MTLDFELEECKLEIQRHHTDFGAVSNYTDLALQVIATWWKYGYRDLEEASEVLVTVERHLKQIRSIVG